MDEGSRVLPVLPAEGAVDRHSELTPHISRGIRGGIRGRPRPGMFVKLLIVFRNACIPEHHGMCVCVCVCQSVVL